MRVWAILCVGVCAGVTAVSGVGLESVYPAGGCAGSEFEVEVGGTSSALTHAVFSGEGVKATLLGPPRVVTYSKKGRPVVSFATDRCRFKVTIEKGAVPGVRQLRVGTAYQLSAPLGFEVGTLPEAGGAFTNRAEGAVTVLDALPVCVNGRLQGGGDRYRFEARQGATLVAFTEGRVGGRGGRSRSLTFLDPDGKPCGEAVTYGPADAPVAALEIPRDGFYTLVVGAAGGGETADAAYRVKLGELPLVTSFSPAGAQAGESLNVRLTGYNIEQRRVRLFTGGKDSDRCLEALAGESLLLPGLSFDLAEEPGVAEREPNDAADAAQEVQTPCVVSGTLEAGGGRDVFRLEGVKGQTLWADARASGLGSPLRPVVTVRDAAGAVVAQGAFDTNATLRAALCGRDPSLCVTFPADGAYTVEVGDRSGAGGEAYGYRLRLGPPQPDFRLWMEPASLNIPSDGSALVTVHVRRLHGFDGEIRVALEYPPLSIACEGGVVPPGVERVVMTVSTEGVRYPRTVFGLALTGLAQVDGREVRRPVVPVSYGAAPDGLLAVREIRELAAKVGYGARALRADPLAKGEAPPDPRIPMPVAFKAPVPVGRDVPVRLNLLSATLAPQLGGLYVPMVVWPERGFTAQGVQPTNRQERAGVLLQADARTFKAGQTAFVILGCYLRGDTNRVPLAVTQSVPVVIR